MALLIPAGNGWDALADLGLYRAGEGPARG